MSWGDPLSVLGCGVAGLALGYLVGRARIAWMGRPFRGAERYFPPIVSVRPPTTLTESDQSELWG